MIRGVSRDESDEYDDNLALWDVDRYQYGGTKVTIH